jgi:hypothetical protein
MARLLDVWVGGIINLNKMDPGRREKGSGIGVGKRNGGMLLLMLL